MTLRRFTHRLVLVTLFTWIVGAIVESFGWALYWALCLLWLYDWLLP